MSADNSQKNEQPRWGWSWLNTIKETVRESINQGKSEAIQKTAIALLTSETVAQLDDDEAVQSALDMLDQPEPQVVDALAAIAPGAEAAAAEMFQNLGTAHIMLLDNVKNVEQAYDWFEKHNMYVADENKQPLDEPTERVFQRRRDAIIVILKQHWKRGTQPAGAVFGKALEDFLGRRRINVDAAATRAMQNSALAHIMSLSGKKTPEEATTWLKSKQITPTTDNARYEDIMKIFKKNTRYQNQDSTDLVGTAVAELWRDKSNEFRKATAVATVAQIMAVKGFDSDEEAEKWLKKTQKTELDTEQLTAVMAAYTTAKEMNVKLSQSLLTKAAAAAVRDKRDAALAATEATVIAQLMILKNFENDEAAKEWLQKKRRIDPVQESKRYEKIFGEYKKIKDSGKTTPALAFSDTINELAEQKKKNIMKNAEETLAKVGNAVEIGIIARIARAAGLASKSDVTEFITKTVKIPDTDPRFNAIVKEALGPAAREQAENNRLDGTLDALESPSNPFAAVANAVRGVVAQQKLNVDTVMTEIIEETVLAHVMTAAGIKSDGRAPNWLKEHGIAEKIDEKKYNSIMTILRNNEKNGALQREAAIADAMAEIVDAGAAKVRGALFKTAVPAYLAIMLIHIAGYAARQKIKNNMAFNSDITRIRDSNLF